MKLRRLVLHGFKTFAPPTEFLFSQGITAIVGPNGSGKSNVADALRWALGEQSLRAVRGKRTEDIIFAGGPSRAAAGMAEVSITLDNSSNWLPIPFSEVRFTRRAYRSGDHEYLLNNSKVRLRDVNELLLKAGLADSAHVVIGQGMVDLALSLRPEERRAMIDEAADVKRFYVKLHETSEKLAVTEQGLTRARDLLAEIAPRVSVLAEQATKLRQHERATAELRSLLYQWYQLVRDELNAALGSASGQLQQLEESARASQNGLERVGERVATGKSEQADLEGTLGGWVAEAKRLQQVAEELRRQCAVLAERQEAQAQRSGELSGECAELKRACGAAGEELLNAEDASANLEAREISIAAEIQRVEARHSAQIAQRMELAVSLSHARDEVAKLRERGAALRHHLRALTEQRAAAAAESGRRQEVLAAGKARLEAASVGTSRAQADCDDQKGKLAALSAEAANLDGAIAAAEEIVQQMAGQSRRLGRELDERRVRLDALERWGNTAGNYTSGARTVLQAGLPPQGQARVLSGIIGTVADLIRAPREMETAVEVALGGRAQDIVVERWADAEAGIALLKRTGAGRATFLPRDTLRVAHRIPTLALQELKGVRGVAADLVEFETQYQTVIELLLGRTIIVDDLPVARGVLSRCANGWQIVTLDGDVVRTTGAVTGGSRRNGDAGLLARQRELRSLRQEIGRLAEESAQVLARLGEQRELQSSRRKHSAAVEERRRDCEIALRRAEAKLAEKKAEERILAEELRRAKEADDRYAADPALLSRQVEATRSQLAGNESQSAAAEELLGNLARAQETLEADMGGILQELAEHRTALAINRRELTGLREQQALLRARQQQASAQLGEKEARLAELLQAAALTAAARADSGARLESAEGDQRRVLSLIEPARRRLRDLDSERRMLDEEALIHRERLAIAEANQRELKGEVARLQERILVAQQQATNELGPAVAAEIWNDPGQADAAVSAVVEDLKRQIDRARAAIRNLGMLNPHAIEEHEEVAQRHDFLTQQIGDLEEAAKALRRLSADLQKKLRQRFRETFVAVANEFRHYFAKLFAGGTARLVLTQPDDLERTGIDIIAQPPGRRLQNLSLLSGGERALTAAALLFAVLAVRPIPFCVLDEVDAALDEANVARFCDALRDLAHRTQFIVITHNRATMQAADSLYGISMPADSISRVVSLRLAGLTDEEGLGYVRSTATHR